ncbi:MAG: TetR family transcriptional regulator C-terminal domain-containing protein, partial [Gemmatimonadales bacterium]
MLDLYLEWLYPAVIAEPFSRTSDPIERVFEILADYRERIVSTGFTYHCPIGSLGPEIGGSMPAARAKVAASFEGWRGWVKRCLDDAADRL